MIVFVPVRPRRRLGDRLRAGVVQSIEVVTLREGDVNGREWIARHDRAWLARQRATLLGYGVDDADLAESLRLIGEVRFEQRWLGEHVQRLRLEPRARFLAPARAGGDEHGYGSSDVLDAGEVIGPHELAAVWERRSAGRHGKARAAAQRGARAAREALSVEERLNLAVRAARAHHVCIRDDVKLARRFVHEARSDRSIAAVLDRIERVAYREQ